MNHLECQTKPTAHHGVLPNYIMGQRNSAAMDQDIIRTFERLPIRTSDEAAFDVPVRTESCRHWGIND